MCEDDVYGMYVTNGFDMHLFAIFSPMLCGASVRIIPRDIRLDLDKLAEFFNENKITHTFITTQVGKLFYIKFKDSYLKYLVVAGEKLCEITFEQANYRLIDVYGPSGSIVVSYIDVSEKVDYSSVGHVVDNVKSYILDDEFRRVPIGAVGELYLSGNQLADGYLNLKEETSKAFINNPFDGNGLMYRTGDFVRILPDGSLGIVGRRDHQVKIRGNRLELSEVESTIRKMDIIDDVTVQTIKNGENNELVAYVVSSEFDDDVVRDAVQGYVGSNKPNYMIPSFVIKLDEIPLNVNGKVDKHALPEVNVEELQVEYVAPTTETEKHIVEAFEEVFNQDKIGVYDDFAHLGGDSLAAIKIISILSKYDITVNFRVIFDNKTPYQIAKFIDEERTEYGFYLAKKGTINQNMFILPPIGGISGYFYHCLIILNLKEMFTLLMTLNTI